MNTSLILYLLQLCCCGSSLEPVTGLIVFCFPFCMRTLLRYVMFLLRVQFMSCRAGMFDLGEAYPEAYPLKTLLL